MFDLVANAIAEEPWILTAAHGASQPPNLFDELRPSAKIPAIPGDAGAWRILRTIWPFERHLISDGYDIALRTLASVIPIKQRMFPTGMHAWTWIVPERWRCDEATVRTTDGRVVFSSRDNPLHVASYSMPKQGRISRDELMSHLVTHAIPDAVPFAYRYYRRDWTLCCSLEQAARLTDDFYDVEIRARFSRGKLAVGELIIPGKSERTVMLCAHLCHPSMANDDAAGVAVAVEVARRLLGRDGANEFTYVLTIVPETIGTVAYLSSNDTLRTKLVGGLFFEMLALPYPHALQLSLNGDTVFDRLWALICREHDPASRTGPFLGVITNDERQYNAPGVGVPMLSLSRVLPRSSPEYPYREYHSDHDSIDICSPEALEDSVDLSMKMLDALERNVIAVPKFRGEVFLSRYGLDVARHTDVMFVMDGRRTIADIALKLGLAFEEARSLVEDFHRAGLVDTRSAFDAA
jgi:aminopeptidase-like protein